ncbi:MAG: glycoside hydrolase family 2 TIM barrel-domain containing protein [Bacteroidales bacterium]
MKKLFIILFVLFVTKVFGSPHQDISLNGNWNFILDPANSGESQHWFNALPESARNVIVPHTWNIENGSETYVGLAWYQKQISVPSEWKGKTVRLKFKAIYRDAVIWVNGVKAGEHMNSGYTPFSIDISRFLHYGSENRIVVSVSNHYSDKALPYNNKFDWTNDGGITRDVLLQITGKPSIRFVHISPELSAADSSGNFNISVRFWENQITQATFVFNFREKKSGKILFTKELDLKSEEGQFTTNIRAGKVVPWHFDNPFLYQIESVVKSKGVATDSNLSTFGFRNIELKEEKLFLNGEAVRLPGIEYMPMSNANYGAAEPHAFLDSIVQTMKDLNVVITRFHWQQDETMFDLMDEYGILVQEELPWWQEPSTLNPELFEVAKEQLSETIEAHYNHPSIFAWGLSNEVNGNNRETYTKLKSFVKAADSSRMVNVVSNNIFVNLQKDESLLGDLPTWNEYVGTWHGKHRDELPVYFELIKPAIGNRPLLITEGGLCEPRFTGGDGRRVDEMIFHYNEWCKRPYVIGYIYFCVNDYRTQMGEEGLGKFKIRRHGVTNMYNQPKPSYYIIKQLSSPVEIIKVEKAGEPDVIVGIKVKNTIPSYTIRNYRLRYINVHGILTEIGIPVLNPGQSYEVLLKEINPRYAFEILRPDGFLVVNY